MKLFRIAKTGLIADLTGSGARMYGGRWNNKGTPVIYTSESRALAALEYLVHVPLVLVPDNLSIREFDIPDGIRITEIGISDLPPDWTAYPPPDTTAEIGDGWIKRGRTLLLKVPSVVVTGEYNVLINPLHPDFNKVTPAQPEPFFDKRLLRGSDNQG